MTLDIWGNFHPRIPLAAIEGMSLPVECAYCQRVYDLGTVEVVHRYTDCSMWRCPGCRRLVDDRGDTGWKSRKDYYKIDRATGEVRR